MSAPALSRVLRPVVAIVSLLCTLTLALPAGASSGPTLIKNINPSGDSNPSYLTRVGSQVFFAANDGTHGKELWKTDGTATGTKMVRNIRPYGRSSSPADLINVNGMLFFTADDGQHGRQLWKSDGTAAGTLMVVDLTPGPPDTYNTVSIHTVATLGSRLAFIAEWCCAGANSLMVTDGTADGTHRLSEQLGSTRSAAVLGTKLYFAWRNYQADPAQDELWVTNGTSAGTHRVNGSPSAGSIVILQATGRYLYFVTWNMVFGQERLKVWRTDGTAAATRALTTPGELTFLPTESVYMDHAIYFNGGTNPAGDTLWRTNGTADGTNPISVGAVRFLSTAAGRLYFARSGHLWTSNGTTSGTKDIAGFGSLWPRQLVAVGGVVCFAVQDWDGGTWKLWESNGTVTGTYAVKQFVDPYATAGDGPLGLAVGSRLYFAADDGSRGVELWRYTP